MKQRVSDIIGRVGYVLAAVALGVVVAPFVPIIFGWFAWKEG